MRNAGYTKSEQDAAERGWKEVAQNPDAKNPFDPDTDYHCFDAWNDGAAKAKSFGGSASSRRRLQGATKI